MVPGPRLALLTLLAVGALAPAAAGEEHASPAGVEEAPAATPTGAGAPALGAGEAQLRAAFGAALREEKVEPVPSLTQQILELGRREEAPEPGPEPFPGQLRLVRDVDEGDVRRVEYDLREGRVYRVRWRLAPRFEEPVLEAMVARLRARLGEPAYDQVVEPRFGSGRSKLRRVGWRRGERALELRQLHPLVGGPVYLTLSDLAALRAISEAREVALPEPARSESWWRRPQRETRLPTAEQAEELAAAVDAVAAEIPFPAASGGDAASGAAGSPADRSP